MPRIQTSLLITALAMMASCAAVYRTDINRVFVSPQTLSTLETAPIIEIDGDEHRLITTSDGEQATIETDAELVILTKKARVRFRDPAAVTVTDGALTFTRKGVNASIPLDRVTSVFLERSKRVRVRSAGDATAKATLITIVSVVGSVATSLAYFACCVPLGS